MSNQKIYKISGSEENYFFLEYECPKLENKIDIEIPRNIANNSSIKPEDIETLYNEGLIDEFLYDTIYMKGTAQTVYFVAEEVEENLWICTRLRKKDNRLIGRLSNKKDKYKYQFFWIIYAIIYFTIMYFVVEKIIRLLGPAGPGY